MNSQKETISVTHLNIRESIAFMVLKLIFLEVVFDILIVILNVTIFSARDRGLELSTDGILDTSLFFILVFIKILLMVYIILNWINDYYEITPHVIIHRSGIIFRKESRHVLKQVGKIGLNQNLLGRILNYGTIYLFDTELKEYTSFYLVHNPEKYVKVLADLCPDVDVEKSTIREHIHDESVE